jgi:hypothetical protein
MNIHSQITPRKPTYYDRSTSIDWTVSITRNGVCLFESDCTLTINFWPYETAQVSVGDDFSYEIEAIKFRQMTVCQWVEEGACAGEAGHWHKEYEEYTLTSDTDAPLFKLLTDELNKPSEAKKLKEAIAAKIGDE